MRFAILALALVLTVSNARAQSMAPYAAPDRELWGMMVAGFSNMKFTRGEHEQIQKFLSEVQREAEKREMEAKPPKLKENK